MQMTPQAEKLLRRFTKDAQRSHPPQHRGAPTPPTGPRRKPQVATPDDAPMTLTFTIRRGDGPALRSAIDEIRQKVGQRLEGAHLFAKEHSLTNAAIALACLAAVLNAEFAEDPHYG